ncbi:elongation factor 2-like [Symsagittifera roscoffensis]|uniref:elongation factor 2-like n=1 Tax=Symsagittifera roscoffensis TaxID=84072 RepID=UPI00307B9E15
MASWLPIKDTLLDMTIVHIPSPVLAQKYRTEIIYNGPDKNDPCAEAIKNCDPTGELMVFVSRMIPTADKRSFVAFGRVFSGTVVAGGATMVKIMGPDFDRETQADVPMKSIEGSLLMMGNQMVPANEIECGTLCGLTGSDQLLTGSGTISTHKDASNFHLHFSPAQP